MGIPDELAARMPLAYVHFTTFLVDTLLMMTPLALFPRLGVVSMVAGPLLVLFYRGLLELSKSFLDPFGNRRMSVKDFGSDINIDTLIGESNAATLVWPRAAGVFPFNGNGISLGEDSTATAPQGDPYDTADAGGEWFGGGGGGG